MKLSVLATIIAAATADITLIRPDKTTGVISSISGCYGIYPTVKELKGANGLKLEFYNDWNCEGKKVEEAVGDKVFKHPVQAASIRVSRNTSARSLRANEETNEEVGEVGGEEEGEEGEEEKEGEREGEEEGEGEGEGEVEVEDEEEEEDLEELVEDLEELIEDLGEYTEDLEELVEGLDEYAGDLEELVEEFVEYFEELDEFGLPEDCSPYTGNVEGCHKYSNKAY